MKKSCLLSVLLVVLAGAAWGQDSPKKVIPILTGTTVAANGTSTYVIDLASSTFGYRPSGDFSLQFKGFTPGYAAGTTINAYWRGANTLPTGVTGVGLLPVGMTAKDKMASSTIVSNMNVATGNTAYVYGFFYIDAVRYLLVDITAGISNLGVSAYVLVE